MRTVFRKTVLYHLRRFTKPRLIQLMSRGFFNALAKDDFKENNDDRAKES
jgi:hypothetical protein